MQSHSMDVRRWIRALAIVCAAAVLSRTAFAHVFPKKQEPGAGATVASPAQVKILFDGALEPSFTTLTVTDADGKQVNVEKASVDPQEPAVISVPLPTLAPGHYTVHWAAVASDGHRPLGDFSFFVK